MSAERFVSGTDYAAGVRWPSLQTAFAEIESARRMSQREVTKHWKGTSIVDQVKHAIQWATVVNPYYAAAPHEANGWIY